MADEFLLDGLDPFELQEREADRVFAHFSSSPGWARPSRCEGWSTRDMLGHLTGLEDYVRAGLDDAVKELIRDGSFSDDAGVAEFNDWQIGMYADLPEAELVERWRAANLANRAELRARGRDGTVDTSIGAYSSWLQSFHYAVEYVTHGDDVYVDVPDDERAERTAWRVSVGRFVLSELEKPVEVEVTSVGVRVTGAPGRVELSTEDFVDATQGRLPSDHPLDAAFRQLLNTVP
jgi:uncharacterized protein (TIGR03083 family)